MSLVAKFPLKANDTEYITIEPKMGINDGMSGYWDKLREEAYLNGYKLQRNDENRDSANWEAVRCTTANEISKVIKQRGQHRRLAIRIKDFLDRIVKHHGHLDLEWLRYVAPDKAKEFLLSIRGLGQKSVECIGLLALNHLAFPVDTNVDRISTRLGWVCPLPDDNLKHFPKPNSIQKCLWSYLCELDQQTLYELHYQMITFGKVCSYVFCTKRNPNCSVCPMKEECKYFESAREGNALLRASRKGSNSSTVCAIEENDIEDNFHEALYEHYVYELPDLHPLLEAVFADDQTSYSPIDVPWKLICNLPKRILHIGSSTMALLKEKSIGNIIACFNTGCESYNDKKT
ncbi:hypothetical protein ZIOFF_028562 [Zingiber officinale]|uniref:HhH-GPD domain-containing protein n=1 Tax=Zingiber officinale TaxID=94328 RepID=A0A8J5LDX3_ZINOF|nr:hypothetical protein ZIOFF_028562 [Zingiber officinale]